MRHAIISLALLAAAPVTASAQPAALDAATATRHLGFLVRPEIGPCYLTSKVSQGGHSTTASDGGAGFAVALGGAVVENLIVGGQAWDYIGGKPVVDDLGSGSSTYSTIHGVSGLVGYGLFVNWYFMPSNAYFAITPSVTRLSSFAYDSATGVYQSRSTDWGFGGRIAAGTEWWVSSHWGLGVSGSAAFSSNRYAGLGISTYSTASFGVSFTATYN